MPHQVRGCGTRKVGKLYLVGSGIGLPCDRLPFEIKPCKCCGFTPGFFRGFTWLHKDYLGGDHRPCVCVPMCPICHPDTIPDERLNEGRFMFMWVGKQFYTTESFIDEAQRMDVCKTIPSIPKGLVLGKTWVLLAHPECRFYDAGFFEPNGLAKSAPRTAAGIFYAFVPQRIEKLIYKSDATEDAIRELEEQGITPIIVEEKEVK